VEETTWTGGEERYGGVNVEDERGEAIQYFKERSTESGMNSV